MIPMRVYLYAAALIAIGLFCWWLYAKGHSAGEAEVRAEYAEALAKAEKEAKEQRGRDQAQNQKLSGELEAIRTEFDTLKAQPPKTVVQYKEVPINAGQTTCPVASISAEWMHAYNGFAEAGAGSSD